MSSIDPEANVEYCPGVEGGTSASMLTQTDPACPELASQADDVIVVAGTDSSTGTESSDRPNVDMPGAQNTLIQNMAAGQRNCQAAGLTAGAWTIGSETIKVVPRPCSDSNRIEPLC